MPGHPEWEAGYNRTWRTHLPVTKMYEAGSIFHFTYEGTLRPDRMEKIFDEGVGVRRTEGFGRVTFLKDYEQVNRKFPEVYAYTEEEADANARRLSVEEQSVLKTKKRGASGSRRNGHRSHNLKNRSMAFLMIR